MSNLSSFLFELRFKPSAVILDKRGQIAEALVDESLPVWSIGADRIDISNPKNKKFHGVFTHQAFAFYGNLIEADEFKSMAKSFFQKAWSFFPRGSAYRLGVRAKFVNDLQSEEFSGLVEKYRNTFVKIENTELEELGTLSDIAFPTLEMKSGEDQITISSGPMKKEQIKTLMEIPEIEESEIPDVGVFVDVDYFNTNSSFLTNKQAALDFIGRGINKANVIDEKINEWLSPSGDAD
jgi:hypothetical protein